MSKLGQQDLSSGVGDGFEHGLDIYSTLGRLLKTMALGMASIITVSILLTSSVSSMLSNHSLDQSVLMNPYFATLERDWR
jgi:hypothetical protein